MKEPFLIDPKASVAPRGLDRDKLAMVHRGEAARLAHEALFPVQHAQPEEMLMSVALLLTAISRRCRIPVRDITDMATRILDAPPAFDREVNTHLEVLRDFAGARIMGEEVTIG